MIDQQRIEQAEKNVADYIQQGWLFTKRKDIAQYTSFFLKNAETSLLTAKALMELSTDSKKKQSFALQDDFETYLWVVVSSYYSMFYSALALLADNQFKIGDKLVHKVVSDTLIAHFLKNQKLAKLLDAYEEARDEALQIVGSQERAKDLVESYEFERKKRGDLQYELGSVAKQNLATTSLQRAGKFVAEIRTILLSK
ncbi:MAG TPA: hypothetical protein VJH22_03000 [Candidatus Nanoarchaeia archaeon]|nr:hypothetical protein [Candidatus Nanoarchaeia archaeon]